ncbi:hypothetical protein D9611_011525 [Ephemerocybe angulata]|uniref:Uncharacterized protein n=1 Tax=Ephemerocybe angulata TaxID=980116 RepID=A0A8H5AV58_9AGAR|nr:hypothetical protein D9611_011525 [Tulosesus angulatus]
MANLSSGKRPGDRDVDDARGRVAAGDRDRNGHGHGGESGRQAKRTRRESPEKGDWRDVHFKENERERDRDRNRDRSGYSSRRDREDYRRYDRSSRRGDHKTGGKDQERWSRSRSRTRSRSKSLLVNTEPPLNYGEDDEKEEGDSACGELASRKADLEFQVLTRLGGVLPFQFLPGSESGFGN